MNLPRVMISATGSGNGKTLITCGLLQVLVNRGLKTASFKCGPDYIDPMFHSKVIGAKSRNLDTFITDDDMTRYLFAKTAKDARISVMEGVMGFYDGLGGKSTKASAYDLANVTDTPVILIVNCKGMSLSVLPVIKGFTEYRKDNNIKGVILNQMSAGIYPEIKAAIEEELGIRVFGYVPNVKDCVIESRHLGLVTPEEIDGLHNKLNTLANVLEDTLEIDEIIKLADGASKINVLKPDIPKVDGEPIIGVAKDVAFCFYYEDNIELLKEMGAKIVEFSPIHDKELPKNLNALILGGGYPELAAKQLSENKTMLESVKKAIESGMPCVAECGGFMYLHESMEDMDSVEYKMVGAIKGKAYRTDRLNRFGYIELTCLEDNIIAKKDTALRGHEFHYFDSTCCGESFRANKPLRKRNWNCINTDNNLVAGFPHLYYYSNIDVAYEFIMSACKYMKKEG